MDDIHVSNFAALLKQLSRNHGRQVIAAVHQRELFDYLKLELTPASSGQQLLAVSIERLEDGDTKIFDERITYEADDAIRAAS
jgi:exonuclease SbcC